MTIVEQEPYFRGYPGNNFYEWAKFLCHCGKIFRLYYNIIYGLFVAPA